MKWWVLMDWADAHMVRVADELPGIEWNGPFNTFTEMKTFIIEAGVLETENLNNQVREWRAKTKGEALDMSGDDW